MKNDFSSTIRSSINVADDRSTTSRQHKNDDDGDEGTADALIKNESSELSEIIRPSSLTANELITDTTVRPQLEKR